MEKIIKAITKKKNIKNTGLIVIISFIHFISSIPFLFISATHMWGDDIKAYWQPPIIVFEIIWPILYALLGSISLYALYFKETNIKCKTKIVINSFFETIIQTLWLISFGRYIISPQSFGRYGFQYHISLIIIIILMLYAWFVRLPNLIKCNKKLALIYIPYALWISFTTILNAQILYIYTTRI